jgi:hypothetical protein
MSRYQIKHNFKEMQHLSAFTRKKTAKNHGLTFIAVVFVLCLAMQSCRLNPICPAYAEAEATEQPAVNV